jgi:hypothetical protein
VFNFRTNAKFRNPILFVSIESYDSLSARRKYCNETLQTLFGKRGREGTRDYSREGELVQGTLLVLMELSR